MIPRLLAGYERFRQFRADAMILAATLAGIAVGVVSRPNPRDYPLRCRGCGRPIRLATREHPSARARGVAMYRDWWGGYACDGTLRTRHTPDMTI